MYCRTRIARVRTYYIPHFNLRSDQNFWNLPESSGKPVNRNNSNFLPTRKTTTTRPSSWRRIRFEPQIVRQMFQIARLFYY